MKQPSASEARFKPLPFSSDQEVILRSWTTYYPYPIMGLLEAMRQVQQWHLCVRPEDEAYLAELFKTTAVRVREIATFFPMFTRIPMGRKRVGVCHGLSCAMAGAKKVCASLEKGLGVEERVTTKDGEFSWEEMECIGACDFAPAYQINDELQGKATDGKISELVKHK